MSVYFEVRFKDVLLDLTDRPDITRWIKASYDAYILGTSNRAAVHGISSEDMEVDISLYPENIDPEKWHNNICYNLIDDDCSSDVRFKDNGHVLLDCTFGSKNRDNGIEAVILYLLQFYISGAIYVQVDSQCSELDIDKVKGLESLDLLRIYGLTKNTTDEECEVLFYS